MKAKLFLVGAITLAALLLTFGLSRAQTLGEAALIPAGGPPLNDTFTYQGSLTENGAPANGLYDFQAAIWDWSGGGNKKSDCDTGLTQNITVDHGLFSFVCSPTTVYGVFDGGDRYMEVKVKKDSAGAYTTLPRQSITPVPYAWGLRPGAVVKDDTTSVSLNYYLSIFGFDFKDGLQVLATDEADGVYGIFASATNTQTVGDAYGVYATAEVRNSGSAYSIYGYGDNSNTVSGFFTNTAGLSLRSESDNNHAIEGVRYSGSESSIYAYTYGTGDAFYGGSVGGYGINARTYLASNNYGIYTPDNLYSLNYNLRGSVMRVVQNGSAEPLEAGDVVVFSGIGEALDADGLPVIQVARAASANSAAVAGVVYSRFDPNALPQDGSDVHPAGVEVTPAGAVQPGEYLLLVVEGPALVKVSALGGGVQPGDLLSTSVEAGYAEKAATVTLNGVNTPIPGTIFGKALEALTEGAKMIYVYVTLQ